MICTFFGHRDAPEKLETVLGKILTELIEEEQIDLFLVGNNGSFDALVYRQLKTLAQRYNIKYFVVSAYVNEKKQYENLIVADGCEKALPKFAILHRNMWMLKQAELVITYVNHPSSGAGKMKDLAVKQGKKVINIIA